MIVTLTKTLNVQSPTEAEQELLLGAWLCPSCGGACVEKVDEAEMYMRWRAGLVGQEVRTPGGGGACTW